VPHQKLHSARLVLEPITTDDVAVLVRHWSEQVVRRYLWKDAVVDDETVGELVAASDADFAQHGYGIWALRGLDAESLIGMCGLRQLPGHAWPELLYSIRPRYWAQGLAQEAARAVLTHGFEELGLERVVAAAEPQNQASTRVLRKLGMMPFESIDGAPYASVTRARFRELSR
jgi:[ribosomal protein S5]-alanine N-acetyltransferase